MGAPKVLETVPISASGMVVGKRGVRSKKETNAKKRVAPQVLKPVSSGASIMVVGKSVNMDDKHLHVPNAPSKVTFLKRYVKVVYQKY